MKKRTSQWRILRRAFTVVLIGGALQSPAALSADKPVALAMAPANPTLIARVNGVDDESTTRRSLRIADLDIDVKLVGSIARITLLARFANPTDELLEGEFSLALPNDAVVTGYALDVEGQMIDGVLAEPARARIAYRERIRRRVDPGVGEVSRANLFTTQVYPILENSGRTIRLTFVAPVHPVRGFVLPLVTDASVRNLKMTVRAESLGAAPDITVPDPLKLDWRPDGAAFVASAAASRVKLSGDLQIRPVATTGKLLTTVHPSGGRFFQMTDTLPVRNNAAVVGTPTQKLERLRVYWDRSLSRRDDALADEIALIERYITATRPSAIDVVTFNSSGAKVTSASTSSEVRQILTGLDYRGATSFAPLRAQQLNPASHCIVFSDGVVTIDRRDDVLTDCRTSAVTSADDADLGYLHRLVRASGGEVVRLGIRTVDAALAALRSETPRIIDVRDDTGRALGFATFDAGTGAITAVGEAPASGEIVVRISGVTEARRYSVPSVEGPRFDGAGALWAADRVALLAAEDSKKNQVRTTSRRYSVASPAMSFIVLETAWDYVNADLPLPRNYPSKGRAEYRQAKADRDAERAAERASRLQDVIAKWEEQKGWWQQEFPTHVERKAEKDDVTVTAERRRGAVQNTPMAITTLPSMEGSDALLQEVVTTGNRRAGGAAGASIEIQPWAPDRPYLKALKRASRDGWAAALAQQEKLHGTLPAFYFDVAEWLYRQKRRAEAEEMMLSALELPAANVETQGLVADRLVRYGSLQRAIWLYGRIHDLGPERPQPLRAMALALMKRASSTTARNPRRDLSRAFDLLTEVIMTPWQDAYEGIELIALMDVNALMPRLKTHGVATSGLDPRLVAPLDVDLRVVIEWNTSATDMDLWLDEPTGERAVYSHPKTTVGGRLSNDMTEGYGPEEYLLRRAPDGQYQIQVNAFARDQLNPNGATTVTAHVFRDFGRAEQREETMDLELRPGEEGVVRVGQFVVGTPKSPPAAYGISESPQPRE